jgi:WD40 repeat protein
LVAAATDAGIKVYYLMSSETKPIAILTPEDVKPKDKDSKKPPKLPMCNTLTWNCLGKKLFAGFSDGTIRVWHVISSKK